MAEISAKNVAALRKITGAGMMDCKKALEENSGDVERAKDWLREKGLAGAAKREGRAADQGAVDVFLDGNVAAVVELNCETDFVAKGDQFKAAVAALAKLVATSGADDVANLSFEGVTVGEHVAQMSATMGEKIELGRIARFETAGGVLDAYKHIQSERGVIGVLVEVTGSAGPRAAEVAHDVALHIASAAPRYVRRDEVPADDVARERAVFEAQTKEEGKPEQAWPKIIDGKLNGYFKTVVLEEQPFVKEPKQTVGQIVGVLGDGAKIARFVRIKIGED
ncbi:MAG TPA: translation elongation factor Ts [Acidimicrobiia bacterium]|jgi:elongation factor Ts